MSQENVEIWKKAWDAWTSGDPAGQTMLDPNVTYETDMLPDSVGETYHGIQGMLKAWARWLEPWENLETTLEWVRDAGESVVSSHRIRARGKGSGVEIDTHYTYVIQFREGKIAHLKTYGDVGKALEAVGLRDGVASFAKPS